MIAPIDRVSINTNLAVDGLKINDEISTINLLNLKLFQLLL
jgi:hypothetical protein